MFLRGKIGLLSAAYVLIPDSDIRRTAEQSAGGKVVGVDSTVITARQ